MFVRLTKKPNDKVSIRIVENKRIDGKVKQQTVAGVGTAHKDDQLKIDSLKRVAEQMIIKLKNEERPALPGFEEIIHTPVRRKNIDDKNFAIDNLVEEERISKGIDDIFGQAFDQLNLFDSINTGYKQTEANDLFKKVVTERISRPDSKRKTTKNIKRNKAQEIPLEKIYRMMDKVHENSDHIKNLVRSSTLNLLDQKVRVAFFDVTTLYFESFNPDELRNFGFSKDNKFKETQVMLALITTTEGLPLGYELFPGNTYEGSTLITVMDDLGKKYNIEDTFIVADRGMFNKNNLAELDRRKIKFIVAAKLKSMKKAVKEMILTDVEKLKSEHENVSEWSKDYFIDGRRFVVSYSEKRAVKDQKDRNRLIDRLKKKTNSEGKIVVADLIKNSGTKKYLKLDRKGAKEATINEDKIHTDSRWDGIHGIVTNHIEGDFSASQLLQKYRDLWQIEAAFRVNKHDLKMRPIYHWTPRRIKAHILICFVAYSLTAIIRYKLKKANLNLSFAEIREELNYLQTSILKDKRTNTLFELPGKITSEQRSIYKALGLTLNNKPKIIG